MNRAQCNDPNASDSGTNLSGARLRGWSRSPAQSLGPRLEQRLAAEPGIAELNTGDQIRLADTKVLHEHGTDQDLSSVPVQGGEAVLLNLEGLGAAAGGEQHGAVILVNRHGMLQLLLADIQALRHLTAMSII